MKTCPACGASLVARSGKAVLHLNGIKIDPVNRTITHKGTTVRFRSGGNNRSILFDAACRLIIGPPATYDELCDSLYGFEEDGGPEWGRKAVEIHAQHLKPKLKQLQLNIYKNPCSRSGSRCFREFKIAP